MSRFPPNVDLLGGGESWAAAFRHDTRPGTILQGAPAGAQWSAPPPRYHEIGAVNNTISAVGNTAEQAYKNYASTFAPQGAAQDNSTRGYTYFWG